MSFYGYDFVFNQIASENFGLKILSFDSPGVVDTSFGASVDIIEDTINRRFKPFFYGTRYNTQLEFEFTFGCEKELDAYDRQAIGRWLFGKQGYSWLMIDQKDLEGLFFNVIFTDPKVKSVGNLAYAFTCTARLDSPFAWSDEFTYTNNITDSQIVNINNISDFNGYIYPKIIYTLGSSATGFSIINTSDNNREFSVLGCTQNEVLTIDCDLGVITSSLDINRLGKTNYKFLRLVPGWNTLQVTGTGIFNTIIRFPKAIGS